MDHTLADPLQFSVPKAPVDVSNETTGAEDIDKQPAGSVEDENPFDQLPDNRSLTPIPDLHLRDHQLPDNHPVTPIPDLHSRDDQLPDNRPLAPIAEFHLRDNGGPSEPISWAFQRQALGNPFDAEPRSSPLGAFGEENSSPPRPIPPSPTAVNESYIDPDLLRLSAMAPTLPIQNPAAHSPTTTRTVTQASAHPLSSLSNARPSFVFDTFLSAGLSKAAPTTPTTLSVANALVNASAPSSDNASVATTTQLTPATTSPRSSLAATTIIASLTDAVSTPTSTPVPVPPSSTAARPPGIPATQPLTAVIHPVSIPGPPLGIETRPARKPTNATVPKELSTQPRGRGKGRGGRGKGKGGRGG